VTGHRLEIDFALNEGALLRVVGLVERRGFEVRGIRMNEAGDGRGALSLDLRPRDAGRNLGIVAGHLKRLYDVHAVSCFSPEPTQGAVQ
jgi:acetolactate synthase regulatory subunit